MIGQYLPNNNETVTIAFRQKFCQLNSPNVATRSRQFPYVGSDTLKQINGTYQPYQLT
jgi:hypothetical protein